MGNIGDEVYEKALIKQTMNDQPTPAYSIPQRFYSLDAARGVAALSVVLFHWHLFFLQGTANFDFSTQPLYNIFFAFYTNGFFAVRLFFALSGFVFFWLYSDRIGRRKISTRSFVVLRLSRLYPLHLATLFIVLAGQEIIHWRTGIYFINAHNDLYHFILNIFFASFWGLQHGYSFNAPVWSVSIEVLLYAIFFIACLCGAARRAWALCLIAAGGLLMTLFVLKPIYWWALFLFFSGGLIFKLYSWLLKKRMIDMLAKPLFILTLTCWAAAFVEIRFGRLHAAYHYSDWAKNMAVSLLFLATILTLVILETKRGHLGVRMSFLGDISYSSYLIHFPLMLFSFGFIRMIGGSTSFFLSTASLVLFFSVLLTLSYLSYRCFERPVQKLIRNRFIQTQAHH